MKINLEYLKNFIRLEEGKVEFKALLGDIGIEVGEIADHNGQQVFEVEITPNRPDWLSHYGVAREFHARMPAWELLPLEVDEIKEDLAGEDFTIEIASTADCKRYTGCIIRDIQVKESGPAVKDILSSLGLRPINNIVDVSNLVLMTIGQPIHIFDLDKLTGNKIKIRRAYNDETLKLLDEQTKELIDKFLVIADQQKPVALAGVMGGYDSGVTFSTRNIFIESAYFDPFLVRRASRTLGLITDASYRFERGGDIMITRKAIEYALRLIRQSQAQDINITYLNDVFPKGFLPQFLEMEKDFPGTYAGIPIDDQSAASILQYLGFKVTDSGSKIWVQVPSFRVDIHGKEDLVEEITRIYGYDKLASHIPLTANTAVQIDTQREITRTIRNHFIALGFNEVINYSFQSPEENLLVSAETPFIEIKNPLGKDFSVMRNSLVPGLIRNTVHNFNQSIERVALFEFGRTFSRRDDRIVEKEILGISASGEYMPGHWQRTGGIPFDFYLFKSFVAGLLKRFKLPFTLSEKICPYLREGTAFSLVIDGKDYGSLGELAPAVARACKLEKPLYVADIDFSAFLDHIRENRFKPWNKFPAARRDFSFLIDKTIKYMALEAQIEALKPRGLEAYILVDKYEGENIPADKVSLSMSFSYRDQERTLTNEEVNRIHQDWVRQLIENLRLIQR